MSAKPPILLVSKETNPDHHAIVRHEYVVAKLGDQLFGLSVMNVQDVIRYQTIAPIPLAPPVVYGSLNLRGRIVTALSMRERLRFPPAEHIEKSMMIVIEHRHELFALIVDGVGDVLSLAEHEIEKVPANLDADWRGIATGVHKLEGTLLVMIDVALTIDHLVKEEVA